MRLHFFQQFFGGLVVVVLRQAMGEHVVVAGIVRGAADALQMLGNPLDAPSGHQPLVQVQGRGGAARPDAHLMHVFDVLFGLRGGFLQVLLHRLQTRARLRTATAATVSSGEASAHYCS
jgi:hypothetical protein